MKIRTHLTAEQLEGMLHDLRNVGLIGEDLELDIELIGIKITGQLEFRAHLSAPRKVRAPGGKLRRPVNMGSYAGSGRWAATHDEWGWWLALLFERDPHARAGTYTAYAGFHEKTGRRFAGVIDQMELTQRATAAAIAAGQELSDAESKRAISAARRGAVGWGSGLESGPIGFRERVPA